MPEAQSDPLNPTRKLYTYETSERPFAMPKAAAGHIAQITAHVEKHIGKSAGVFHEIVSDQVHLDVIVVPPNEKFPDWTLITSGMSDRPMKPPGGDDKEYYAELLIRLPPTWPVGRPGKNESDDWKKEENFWPTRLLKFIARFPHKYRAFLWVRHTLDNGQPAKPWSPSVPFKGAFLAPSRTLPQEFENLKISENKTIKFIALYPAYLEETALARAHGAETLWQKFVEHTVTDVLDVNRPNLVEPAGKPKATSFWKRMTGR
jgi:hypothetical protein